MKRVFIVSLMLVVCLAAAAQKKKELTTLVNVNYTLPKVAYEVEVILECERFVPGPYQNYAEKELGIRPEATQVSEKWAIKKINVLPQYIPDEKAVYSVSANGDYWPVTLSLSAEGFLAGIAAGKGEVFNEKKEMKYIAEALGDEERIDIMKLNTYNQLKEVLDTNYTYQEVDGEMKRIWDPIVHYAVKTDSDNVKEAVSEIFRIRSERVKLLGSAILSLSPSVLATNNGRFEDLARSKVVLPSKALLKKPFPCEATKVRSTSLSSPTRVISSNTSPHGISILTAS